MLAKAQIPDNDLSYITYWADNVAAGADRRTNDESYEWGYDKYVPLASIFNILNDNHQNYSYDMQAIYDDGKPNNPKETGGSYAEGTSVSYTHLSPFSQKQLTGQRQIGYNKNKAASIERC